MDYSFDLISGKVNLMYYQKGKGDQFIYKYHYDIENRLTSAMSSRDGLLWQSNARYNYYLHGPLARTELGALRVQGVDNAYTLQGWIKYINGPALNEISDIGRDGDKTFTNSLNTFTSRDAMSYGISYFDGEYKPIKTGPLSFSELIPVTMGTGNDIFTGSIRATTLQISGLGGPVTYSYRYDQLNRLIKMRKHESSYTISAPNLSGNLSISTPTDEYGEQISYDANGNIKTYERNGVSANMAMDKLTYQYEKDNGKLTSNKLRYIHDQVGTGAYNEDIDDQTGLSLSDVQNDVNSPSPFPNNYNYDGRGNLIHDTKEKIEKIEWNVYGKISKIIMSNLTQTTIEYEYDPTGNRIYKKVTNNGINASVKYTYYIRDASGNVMAVYDRLNSATVIWTEQHLYGSSRLGMISPGITVPIASSEVTVGGSLSDGFEYGKVSYELMNHLSNVLATMSDKKKAHDAGNGNIDYYIPDVITANDYYPFGMTMPNRSYTNSGSSYNYGMNGQQKTKELGDNFYEALYWQYDSRIGRRWNVDPKEVTGISVYSVFSNNPIYHIDILGDSSAPTSTKEQALSRIQELAVSLKQSTIWKNVSAADFVKAMQERVNKPTEFNQGHGTNFCWAAACMSYVYEKNPLGMVNAMFSLYTTGDFRYSKGDGYITSMSNPSPNIRNEPGSPNSSFKNDIGLTNKADQMLLLMLGGAFKSYLNTDRHYESGDQDRDVITEGGWGASSLAKAHELWNSFGYQVKVSGTDIIGGAATVSSTTTALKTYDIVLFVNGPLFLHDDLRFKNITGTHFIRVDQITNSGGKYNIHYWDYGGWKYRSTPISAGRFSDGTYGIIQIER
jgi:RHS repeat-associated protein